MSDRKFTFDSGHENRFVRRLTDQLAEDLENLVAGAPLSPGQQSLRDDLRKLADRFFRDHNRAMTEDEFSYVVYEFVMRAIPSTKLLNIYRLTIDGLRGVRNELQLKTDNVQLMLLDGLTKEFTREQWERHAEKMLQVLSATFQSSKSEAQQQRGSYGSATGGPEGHGADAGERLH